MPRKHGGVFEMPIIIPQYYLKVSLFHATGHSTNLVVSRTLFYIAQLSYRKYRFFSNSQTQVPKPTFSLVRGSFTEQQISPSHGPDLFHLIIANQGT